MNKNEKLETLIRAAMEYVESSQNGKAGDPMLTMEELQFFGMVHSVISKGSALLSGDS